MTTATGTAPQVGDILVDSWGYDQTNIDYYQVTKVSASMLTIRRIAARVAGSSVGYDHLVPVPGSFQGDPIRRKIRRSYSGYACEPLSYSWATLWDGQAQHQTAAGWGH